MKIILDWQKRAILLFAVVVLIFSVILTVFAIREAERERLAKQQEINLDLERKAASLSTEVLATIQETEELFSKLLDSEQGIPDENQLADIAKRIKATEFIVDEVFAIGRAGRISFPLFDPLYDLSGDSAFSTMGPAKIAEDPLFKSAETAEFKSRNYSLAIDNYRQLLRSISDRSSRALLLNRIARCYKLSGNPNGAIRTYKQIVKDYPDESSSDGIPFALIALYQLGALYSDSDNDIESITTYLELYDALLESRWEISQAQFNFNLWEVKDKLDSLRQRVGVENIEEDIVSRWVVLQQIESKKLERMDSIERITQKMKSVFMMSEPDSENDSDTFFRLAEITGKKPLLISYTFLDSASMFGFSMDKGYFKDEILPSILAEMSLKDGFVVQIADEEDAVVAGEEIQEEVSAGMQLSYSQGFKDRFPPWTIKIYQTSPSEAERQFGIRRNIYVLSVVVVIVAILFGGVMAIRGTAKELRLAKLKSEFVSTVSHEFRTPLTSIRYLAELLQRGRVKEESKKQQYYESITHESERLSRLIENILDFSKIEAGMKEYEFEETDVAEMCRDVVSRFQEQDTDQEFTIESEVAVDLPKIFADKEAFPRALFNLLDNAVKYSGDSRKIQFRAWVDQNRIFLKVMDQGIGISKDDQDKVFEKFYRSGDIQNSTIKGSGIGLTIVSHIVEAHGGEVILESEPGKGTEVTIQLPIDREVKKGG
jgi:signal transduction histidine kinase/tetratricopeptide (TPR) repeat protein